MTSVPQEPFLVLPLQVMQMLFASQRWHHQRWSPSSPMSRVTSTGFLSILEHWARSRFACAFAVNRHNVLPYARQIGGTGGPRILFPSYYLFLEMQYLSVWETPEHVGGDSRITIGPSLSLGLPRASVGVWHVKLTDFPRLTFTTHPNAQIHSVELAELPRDWCAHLFPVHLCGLLLSNSSEERIPTLICMWWDWSYSIMIALDVHASSQ